MPARFSAPHQRVQLAGALIVVLGWIAAAVVWFAAGAAEGDGDGLGVLGRQREMAQVERLGGRATAQTVEFDEWLGSLWHGQRLAWTLAVLALIVGGGCAYVGGLMAEEIDDAA